MHNTSFDLAFLAFHFLPPGLSYIYILLYLNSWSLPLKRKHLEGKEFVFSLLYAQTKSVQIFVE